jgi:hypothetical protein
MFNQNKQGEIMKQLQSPTIDGRAIKVNEYVRSSEIKAVNNSKHYSVEFWTNVGEYVKYLEKSPMMFGKCGLFGWGTKAYFEEFVISLWENNLRNEKEMFQAVKSLKQAKRGLEYINPKTNSMVRVYGKPYTSPGP